MRLKNFLRWNSSRNKDNEKWQTNSEFDNIMRKYRTIIIIIRMYI